MARYACTRLQRSAVIVIIVTVVVWSATICHQKKREQGVLESNTVQSTWGLPLPHWQKIFPRTGNMTVVNNSSQVGKEELERIAPSTIPQVTLTDPWPNISLKLTPLSQDVVEGVEKFVFFIGYPHSGHSIIGSMMDAHPNMIIAHEYNLFEKWMELYYHTLFTNKGNLFNELYWSSYTSAFNETNGLRTSAAVEKGYSLQVKSSWQGKFTKLTVIGDKSGGNTARYYLASPSVMKKHHSELVGTVGIPVRVVHVVRNPYDMITTRALYQATPKDQNIKLSASEINRYNNSWNVKFSTMATFGEASAVKRMTVECNLTVLELHHADFVRDPKKTLRNICDFLEVECPEDYLQVCYDQTFKTLSKTRNHVVWTEEALNMVEEEMKKYPFFSRYSFMSED